MSESFVDDGSRDKSKIGVDKGSDAPEVEIVDRQMAPKVSVKIERKFNLGDYNSVTAQVFLSSGTLEEYRGGILNDEGCIKEEIKEGLNEIAADLQNLGTNRVLDAIKKHKDIQISVEER